MKRILIILSTLSCALLSNAQTKTVSNVNKMRLSNINYIMKDNSITGYSLFYKVDKVDKKNNSYLLSIMNNNLEETASKTIVESKNLLLYETDYNGKAIMLKFLDPKNSILKYYAYDLNTNLLFTKEVPCDSYTSTLLYTYINTGDGIEMPSVVSVENKGFIDYTVTKDKQIGYKISYFPTDGSNSWTVGSDANSKDLETVLYLENNNNYLLSLVAKKPSLFSNDVKYFLSSIDISAGKEVFELNYDNATYKHQPLEAYFDETKQEYRVIGLYFNGQDNLIKDASKGIFNFILDKNGKIISSTYINWQEGLSKYFKVKDNGKIEGFGYLFFHNLVRMKDGTIYAITEQYQKKIDGVGTAINGTADCNIVMNDLYIIEFTPDFKIKEVTKFEKNISKFYIQGYGMVDAQTLSLLVKYSNGFDYQYTLMNKDDTRFFVTYLDLLKNEKNKYEYSFCYISKSVGENYTKDILPLSTNTSYIRTLPAKQGYVMIFEYDKELKTISMRLEKINY